MERVESGASTAAASRKAGKARKADGIAGCAWTTEAATKWERASVKARNRAKVGSDKWTLGVRERERARRVTLGLRRDRDSPRAGWGMAAGSAAGGRN